MSSKKAKAPAREKSASASTLPDQVVRFCEEYILDLHQANAATRAGYSEKSASQQASRLMADARVQARIQALFDERSKRVEVRVDDVLRELLLIARSDIRRLYKEDGTLLEPQNWPDDVAAVVASVEVDEIFEYEDGTKVWQGYTKKVKRWDKLKALELLGKHLKLFTDKHEVSGTLTLEQLVGGSYKAEGSA